MIETATLLQQFRAFCFQNKLTDLEKALEYFSVFGGLGWEIDTSKSLDFLIEELVLKNYGSLHAQMTKITYSDKIYHALLSAVALGDGGVHAVLKRADISEEDGDEAINYLCSEGLLKKVYTERFVMPASRKNEAIDERLQFTSPFLRFWFAFISPLYQSIQEGDYAEVETRFENRKSELLHPVFEALCKELLIANFPNETFEKLGSYWDREIQIQIVGETASGKTIAGSCRYTNNKVKKSELTKITAQCQALEFTPDITALFSKNGFTNELKSLKGETLRLSTLKNFKKLLENLNEDDRIQGLNKPRDRDTRY